MTVEQEEEFMLLRMLPEQISSLWDYIAPLIEESLPPLVYRSRGRMANVLRAILLEKLVIWFYYDEKNEFVFLVGTTIETDQVTLAKNLFIYCFSSLKPLTPTMFSVALDAISKYGKKQGCEVVSAYVADAQIAKIMQHYGFNANFTLGEKEL